MILRNTVFSVIFLSLIFGAFQNCSPAHVKGDSLSSVSLNAAGMAAKFSTTLQPILTTNCGACHGVNQTPTFAVSDAVTAVDIINQYSLVDLANPANSHLVAKILGGHNSFPASLATTVQGGIQAWAAALAVVPLDTQAPAVMITAPVDGATLKGSVNLQSVASDNVGVVGVQYYLDGATYGAEALTGTFSVSMNTVSIASGAHTLKARARDAAGNTADSAIVNVTLNNTTTIDLIAPTVSISAPLAAATALGTIAFSANASDNVGVIGVKFLVDGVVTGAEDLTSPYSISYNTVALANGTHSFSAQARDLAGNVTTSAAVSVTVNNDHNPPAVAMTGPASGAVTGAVTVTVTASASDNIGVVGVQFLVDGVSMGAEVMTAPYALSFNTSTLANGAHVVSARARDAAGNVTTSTVNVTITVNFTPSPTFTYVWTNALRKCQTCHGSSTANNSGNGIFLDTYANVRKQIGTPPSSSTARLYKAVNSGGKMAGSQYNNITSGDMAQLKAWIDAGALNN